MNFHISYIFKKIIEKPKLYQKYSKKKGAIKNGKKERLHKRKSETPNPK